VTLLVTGATGFIGRAVVRQLAARSNGGRFRLVDRVRPVAPDSRFQSMAGDLGDAGFLSAALDGVDAVIHLVSLPGGFAEVDPAGSRAINVDMTLAIAEQLTRSLRGPSKPRLVFASSIAVFGELGVAVDDATLPSPAITYGAHKWMAEIALADFDRRGEIETVALRLPGIVARPRGATGLKSAFMSDVFHAAAADEAFVFPVGADATLWLMSAQRAATNLIHAVHMGQPGGRALTLPALRMTAAELASALFADPTRCSFDPDPALQAVFGSYPPLSTPLAESLGFAHDGSLDRLIAGARGEA
jgi:nucleoside-diphosphate-sugar epimerase